MIAIIDYGLGNVGSVSNMLMRLGADVQITDNPRVVEQAEKIILPGVGRFDQGMKNLNRSGLLPTLEKQVFTKKTPVLGICLGMQLFSQKSDEGQLGGLGWIAAETVRFRFEDTFADLRVPHMGWNTLIKRQDHPLVSNLFGMPDLRFYFAHSYHIQCLHRENILVETLYGNPFPSIIRHNNIMGVQFHPEKSHKYGLALMQNFIEMAAC